MKKIRKTNKKDAKIIATWKYPTPYGLYSFNLSKELINEFVEEEYYSVVENNKLIAYFCFGISAQIPLSEALRLYENREYTDIGIGLEPSLCGKGLGKEFMKLGLEFAEEKYGKNKFRLTVAAFNKRAIKLYSNIGFSRIDSFIRNKDKKEFYIMTK